MTQLSIVYVALSTIVCRAVVVVVAVAALVLGGVPGGAVLRVVRGVVV